MRPVVVVVADVLDHEPLEMPFVEYDDVIERVPAATPDEAFRDSVLPRTSEAGPLRFDAEALDGADNLLIEVRSTVEDQITRSRVIGKRLPQLLCDPGTRRMPRRVAMQNTPTVVGDYEEAVEHPKGERRHGEEVHRRNRFAVVIQECHP